MADEHALDARTVAWAVLGATLVGAILRLLYIADEGFWFDEFIIREQARMSLGAMLDDMIVNDVHPPLYQLLMIGWYRVVGLADEFWLRLPSAIVGCAVIPVSWALARRLVGPRVALVATVLVAVNEFAVYYSQEARAYSLLLLLSATTVLAWLAVREKGTRLALTLYWVSGVALAYTHAFGILLLMWLTVAWFVARWRGWHGHFSGMRWLGIHLAMAVAYLPWVPSFLAQTARVQDGFWIPQPSWDFWAEYLAKYLGHPGVAWLFLGCLVVAGLAVWRRGGEVAGAETSSSADVPWGARLGFLVGWFVFLLGVPFVISRLSEPIIHAKSAISVVLPISIVFAWAIAQLRLPRLRWGFAAAAVAASIGAIVATNYLAQNREAWREMTKWVGERVDDDDVVVLFHPDYDYFYCYEYYTEQYFPTGVEPVRMLCDERRECADALQEIARRAETRDADRLFVLKQRASSATPPGLGAWRIDRRVEFNNGVLDVMVPVER